MKQFVLFFTAAFAAFATVSAEESGLCMSGEQAEKLCMGNEIFAEMKEAKEFCAAIPKEDREDIMEDGGKWKTTSHSKKVVLDGQQFNLVEFVEGATFESLCFFMRLGYLQENGEPNLALLSEKLNNSRVAYILGGQEEDIHKTCTKVSTTIDVNAFFGGKDCGLSAMDDDDMADAADRWGRRRRRGQGGRWKNNNKGPRRYHKKRQEEEKHTTMELPGQGDEKTIVDMNTEYEELDVKGKMIVDECIKPLAYFQCQKMFMDMACKKTVDLIFEDVRYLELLDQGMIKVDCEGNVLPKLED